MHNKVAHLVSTTVVIKKAYSFQYDASSMPNYPFKLLEAGIILVCLTFNFVLAFSFVKTPALKLVSQFYTLVFFKLFLLDIVRNPIFLLSSTVILFLRLLLVFSISCKECIQLIVQLLVLGICSYDLLVCHIILDLESLGWPMRSSF